MLQQLASVLKGRLTLKNAHKQWLALELVHEVCMLLFVPMTASHLSNKGAYGPGKEFVSNVLHACQCKLP